ncbi:MAG: molybdopterin-dependent oxidoreductase [Dehalococcoidia bacterium]|jgi:predicted molibdopterin-dependent oxidoreductase YjgC|nr:molybdopterin-dependent oxidoreductase [Dehalococcoidia bacterium]MDW8008627.1 molybdopterin-dependent oxidoreductase [Chloroflexota bacterium]
MARLTINGRQIEAPDGAPLVEVIKNAGIFISNLCYVDGLPPYAGCRTCVVEIEGMRGVQLACTTRVTDGMVVRTDGEEAKRMRQAALSLIMSYHSDRCLTCHRIVKCKPGDTCLRDGVVTHRCLTCSKNYRCELQTTCEMLEMAGYEPWEGEERTYYTTPQPEPDRANPFLEFDPQMCIVCTRCVRVCDEVRHTGAITLAGRFNPRIEFGAGGPVHESNCDFCGSCIDVCPTATLMEHPNKWAAMQTERWVPTTCTWCSVGCSIYLGIKGGRGVIVKPDAAGNPFSRDQLCVRGRFHYDFVRPHQRLQRPLLVQDGARREVSWEDALDYAARRLAEIREAHGPDAIGFLGSPLMTNEENYLLAKLARAVVGSPNLDSSAGPVARAALDALREAFGSPVLPSDLTKLPKARTLLVVADDLESSHNVASVRVKDAVIREGAKLIVVAPKYGELCDFATVWLRPAPGQEAVVLAAMLRSLSGGGDVPAAELEGMDAADLSRAVDILREASSDEARRPLAFVYALPHLAPEHVRATTSALCALAVTCLGDGAPSSLYLLPQEANVWGMLDVGVAPDLLPGYRPAGQPAPQGDLERLWGTPVAGGPGLDLARMLQEAGGRLRALVVLGDNPLMFLPGRERVAEALAKLEFLCVIDSLDTATARMAHLVLPDSGPYSKEGTITNADRRVLRLHVAANPAGESRPAWAILRDLSLRLAALLGLGEVRLNYARPAEVMDEIAQVVPLYRRSRYDEMENGAQQSWDGLAPTEARQPTLSLPSNGHRDGHLLITGRGLYTSYEAAALGLEDADRLHREEALEINPEDAAALGIGPGQPVRVSNGRGELVLTAKLTHGVAPGTVFLPLLYRGGAVLGLFDPDEPAAPVRLSRP